MSEYPIKQVAIIPSVGFLLNRDAMSWSTLAQPFNKNEALYDYEIGITTCHLISNAYDQPLN